MMQHEAFIFSGVANAGFSADPASFTVVLGGEYNFAAVGTFNSQTVALQALGPDGSTYLDLQGLFGENASVVNAKIASLAAAGILTVDLSPGTYRVHLSSQSGMTIWASLARCPQA